jgi:hypothetical protein
MGFYINTVIIKLIYSANLQNFNNFVPLRVVSMTFILNYSKYAIYVVGLLICKI